MRARPATARAFSLSPVKGPTSVVRRLVAQDTTNRELASSWHGSPCRNTLRPVRGDHGVQRTAPSTGRLLEERGIGVDELPRLDGVLCDDAAYRVGILRREFLRGISALSLVDEQRSGTICERARGSQLPLSQQVSEIGAVRRPDPRDCVLVVDVPDV